MHCNLSSIQHWQLAIIATRDASRNELCPLCIHKYKTVWQGIRKEGIQIAGYLDDCIVVMPQTTLEEAQQQLKTAINYFT